ncbi:FYVE zinc finger-domain-containing protein [Peziza echinospora]|nr:FYVE zinc finger-domain-containing protein [Peziza echinospora]
MVRPTNIHTPPPPPSSESSRSRVVIGGGNNGGGRRVLGPGKAALSPAIQARTSSNSNTLSPSASTVSLNSTFSDGAPFSREGGGAFGIPLGDTRSNTGELIVCPICSEQMVTLLQLNRHIDDVHREVEEEEKDDVKTWFRKRVMQAKQFQPVAVLNQKLKGLDIFESNAVLASSPPINGGSAIAPPERQQTQSLKEPDEYVTRIHWQKTGSNDLCLDPTCRKPLGVVNGSVNCRKCGKLFCEEHTMYQIKLSRSAQHEPVRGFWCRVCETCFKSRDGYNDHNGLYRDHTNDFFQTRRKTVDRAHLEITRLEKRLTKLTQLLTNPPESELNNGGSFLWSVGIIKNQRRQLEQKVVAWEDDAGVSNCPYCKQTFSKLGIRKHHCRLCGKVVCGDSRTECSSEVGLNVSSNNGVVSATLSEKPMNDLSLEVRICKECKVTVFSKKDFAADIAQRTPDVRAYSVCPRPIRARNHHNDAPDTKHPPTTADIQEASRTRKRMLDAFSQYEAAAKRILNLPSTSPAQLALQKNIYKAAAAFLHMHMLPLKALPKILKNENKKSKGAAGLIAVEGAAKLMLGAGGGNGNNNGNNNGVVVGRGGRWEEETEIEREEKGLKEKMMVLEEQRFLVEGMLADAGRQRRFDEVGVLTQSLRELEAEIEVVRGEVEGVEERLAAQEREREREIEGVA